jgi:protein-S-isoprenylcysteine O-methyltransferase Ste14
MIMITLLGIVAFVTINLLITLWLRYHNGNDGWLQVYRRKGGKVVDKGP